jgi:GNAT superfamily N-acetyltransferase
MYLMDDYTFPEVPQLEQALRAAHRALEGISPRGLFAPEEDLRGISEVISQFPTMVDNAQNAIAAQFGPRISWRAPFEEGWKLIVAAVDFDSGMFEIGDMEFYESAFEGPGGDWIDSPLNRVARAYQREAGWDFAPDQTGIWLLMLAPTDKIGGDDDTSWSGHVVGFLVIQDRDEDDTYESIAHIWTATAWRRRGIARQLLDEAKARFAVAGVEGPYTEDGAAFLASDSHALPEI